MGWANWQNLTYDWSVSCNFGLFICSSHSRTSGKCFWFRLPFWCSWLNREIFLFVSSRIICWIELSIKSSKHSTSLNLFRASPRTHPESWRKILFAGRLPGRLISFLGSGWFTQQIDFSGESRLFLSRTDVTSTLSGGGTYLKIFSLEKWEQFRVAMNNIQIVGSMRQPSLDNLSLAFSLSSLFSSTLFWSHSLQHKKFRYRW